MDIAARHPHRGYPGQDRHAVRNGTGSPPPQVGIAPSALAPLRRANDRPVVAMTAVTVPRRRCARPPVPVACTKQTPIRDGWDRTAQRTAAALMI